MLNLAQKQDVVRVVDDQVLSPTFTAELARTVVGLMDGGATGLPHVANAGECSWYDFARATFELTGTPVRLEPQSTSETRRRARPPPHPAPRPGRLRRPRA